MKKAKEVSDLHSPGSLSPGCSVPWVSRRAALTLCCLAGPVAGAGPILTPSSQDVALSLCKVRALFCKAQKIRSKIYTLNKNKKYEGIALSVNNLGPRRVCSTDILLPQIIFLDKTIYQCSVQKGKCKM